MATTSGQGRGVLRTVDINGKGPFPVYAEMRRQGHEGVLFKPISGYGAVPAHVLVAAIAEAEETRAKLAEGVANLERVLRSAGVLAQVDEELCANCGAPYGEHSEQTDEDCGEICPGEVPAGEKPQANQGYSRWATEETLAGARGPLQG